MSHQLFRFPEIANFKSGAFPIERGRCLEPASDTDFMSCANSALKANSPFSVPANLVLSRILECQNPMIPLSPVLNSMAQRIRSTIYRRSNAGVHRACEKLWRPGEAGAPGE